jgi:hypothetical protein
MKLRRDEIFYLKELLDAYLDAFNSCIISSVDLRRLLFWELNKMMQTKIDLKNILKIKKIEE